MIRWRNYDIGGSEIDLRRETLLREGKLKPKTIEREYLKAKARERELSEAGVEWDKQNGLHELRMRSEKVMDKMDAAADALAKTILTTTGGVAALIAYVLHDQETYDEGREWHRAALKNAAVSLQGGGIRHAA